MPSHILGIDVSEYNGVMDWARAIAAGVKFAIIRVGGSYDDKDKQFERNYAECKRLKLPVGGYFYVQPTISALRHYDNLRAIVEGKGFDCGIALDVELGGTSNSTRAEVVRQLSDYIHIQYGGRPYIYTNTSTGNTLGDWPEWGNHPLWIADPDDNPPVLPRQWQTWHMWQYKIHKPGRDYGGQSAAIDLNWMRETPTVEDVMNVTVEYQGKTWTGVLHA